MEQYYRPALQENFYLSTLNNGLTVAMLPKRDYNHQMAIIATRFGSVDNWFRYPNGKQEFKLPEGIAHFLEHKLFAGKDGDAMTRFSSLGASVNAFTNYNLTAYYFSTSANFNQALEELLNFVQQPYFTEENVEQEKGIIIQELLMYEDDPYYQVYFNLLQGLYHQHPVKFDIGGSVESVSQIKVEDLYLAYKTFYHPRNMFLFLVGDFEPEASLERISKNQEQKDFPTWVGVERLFPEEPVEVKKGLIVKEMEVAQPLLYLGLKESKLGLASREQLKQEIATELLLEMILGKSSNFYQSLYEEGLVDDNFHQHYTLQDNYGFLTIGGKTRDPELLAEKLLLALKSNFELIKEEDFERVLKKYLGEYLFTFNSFELLGLEFISYYFKGINYLELWDIVKEINLDLLRQRYLEFLLSPQVVRSIVLKKA